MWHLKHGDVLCYAYITMTYDTKTIQPLKGLADVYQGLARAGRGAGARRGEWMLRIVESGDVRDDGWLSLEGLQEVGVVQGVRTERRLLRPFDVLVTARSGSAQIALVPPEVSRTVAGVTMLVVRPKHPESGMGHWLWYFLTSTHGRAQLAMRTTMSATLKSLSARSVGEIGTPVPLSRELDLIVQLVEASEAAYAAAIEAARLRREALRDSVIREIGHRAVTIG